KPTTPEKPSKPTTPEKPSKPTTSEKPVTKWPEVKPEKPVITSPGSSSSLPGFVPPRGNSTQGSHG
ncbi:hypothetical protein ABN252_15915, partial [Providencia alcalifaciens]